MEVKLLTKIVNFYTISLQEFARKTVTFKAYITN